MAFQFRLHAVLRIRKSLEQQEEALLRMVNQQIQSAVSKLEQMDQYRDALQANKCTTLQGGSTSGEIMFLEECQGTLQQYRLHLERELSALQQLGSLQRARLEEARRQREIVDSLREKQFGLYREEQARKEQREIDDLFLVRRRPDREG